MRNIYLIFLACLFLSGCGVIEEMDPVLGTPPASILSSENTSYAPADLDELENELEDELEDENANWRKKYVYSHAGDVANPIDVYFDRIFQMQLVEAALNEYTACYGDAWKTEFENLISWMKSKMTYQKDIDNLDAFIENIEKSIKFALELVVVEDFTISSDDTEESRYKPRIISNIGITKVQIYRSAFFVLYDLFPEYIFLDQEYIPSELLPVS